MKLIQLNRPGPNEIDPLDVKARFQLNWISSSGSILHLYFFTELKGQIFEKFTLIIEKCV